MMGIKRVSLPPQLEFEAFFFAPTRTELVPREPIF
jgi:hypothetical protein